MPSPSTTPPAGSSRAAIDLEDLGLDRGAHLLLDRALADLPPGARLSVSGNAAELALHLATWARQNGHEFIPSDAGGGTVVRGSVMESRWSQALSIGIGAAERADPRWGLAARGAVVEAGGPEFAFPLARRDELWADEAPRLYAQAAAAQWDPERAIDWTRPALTPELDTAVAQAMTYLIENENAALLVTARFLAQVHPHFREILQVLAIQAADEARHIEVFARRLALTAAGPGRSTVLGQRSLQTLLDEPDFALASFLLAVMGEGTFLSLLAFLERHAPDPLTRGIMRLVVQDESRHVAFGLAHLRRQLELDPPARDRLALAAHRRADALRGTADVSPVVIEALVVLAGGGLTPKQIGAGFDRVRALRSEMDAARRSRLAQLGFAADTAAEISALHTANFM
jgi:hypothetical protein